MTALAYVFALRRRLACIERIRRRYVTGEAWIVVLGLDRQEAALRTALGERKP